MIEPQDLVTGPWDDYEVIDSGLGRKLERYGKFFIIRPETQALWDPYKPEVWKRAEAEFRFDGGKGSWRKKNIGEEWRIAWKGVRFSVRLTSFKHTGVFPEQAANWEWVGKRTNDLRGSGAKRPQVLNLFGYTGIASIVAAQAGASVTHVDASRQSNGWARDNAKLSEVPADGIRYMLDDALSFVLREVRRGARYDGIILDPPAFGRGPKGEIWKIEENLPKLMEALKKVFKDEKGSFFLLNGYAAGYSPRSFMQVVERVSRKAEGEFGELGIGEAGSRRIVPSGIYARFVVS